MLITVIWFNSLKGFGEAVSDTGDRVFVHYTAIGGYSVDPGTSLRGEVIEESGRLVLVKAIEGVERGRKSI